VAGHAVFAKKTVACADAFPAFAKTEIVPTYTHVAAVVAADAAAVTAAAHFPDASFCQ